MFTLKMLVYGFLLGETDRRLKSVVVILWKMKCKAIEAFQDVNEINIWFVFSEVSHLLIMYT